MKFQFRMACKAIYGNVEYTVFINEPFGYNGWNDLPYFSLLNPFGTDGTSEYPYD